MQESLISEPRILRGHLGEQILVIGENCSCTSGASFGLANQWALRELRNRLAENDFHSGGVVVLKIGQQISVAVKLYGSVGVEPM